ncbi:hypothetical protein SAMN04487939_101372 [Lysobacter sp. yr284]|uniref:hypothetical protein n=1 Tax=Lysobacter sp. yr284 TaxID=1761791 RepID=UPI00089AC27C|nr:hypothetical protein [Lysobacter sp. yr284]SDY23141.1 hypothetical protein SAMN04487939_101372 [Lysobacter sp. yr284]
MDSFLLITVGGKVLLALALWTAVQYAALGPANRRRAQPLANAGLLWRALLGVLAGAALGSALIVVIAGAMLSTGDRVSDAGFLVILLSLPAGLAAAIFCGFRLARRWVLRAQPGAEPAPGPVAEPAADTAGEA